MFSIHSQVVFDRSRLFFYFMVGITWNGDPANAPRDREEKGGREVIEKSVKVFGGNLLAQ